MEATPKSRVLQRFKIGVKIFSKRKSASNTSDESTQTKTAVDANDVINENDTKDVSDAVEIPLGIIDMGSNGIRFSIVQTLARHMPVVFEERAGISLFDAQQQGDSSIPSDIIDKVIITLKRFKLTCEKYNVKKVVFLATEATRTARNSVDFRDAIKKETGWEVELLSKSREAEISSSGVMASFNHVQGLVMDLGGGSVELNYVVCENQGTKRKIESSSSPISLPYGAAAMAKKLAEAKTPDKRAKLESQVENDFKEAYSQIKVPQWLEKAASKDGGFDLYLSGGGFRALGYIAMGQMTIEKRPYPIQIINGLSVPIENVRNIVKSLISSDNGDIYKDAKFRLSKRRIAFLPATAFLISELFKAIPSVRNIHFSEGGVRQGLVFSLLSEPERTLDPLEIGIDVYLNQRCLPHQRVPEEWFKDFLRLINGALPSKTFIMPRIIHASVSLSLVHSSLSKESRAVTGLRCFLTGGQTGLFELPGISHAERAMLGLILCWRHGGSIQDEQELKAVERVVRDSFESKLDGKRCTQECKWLGKVLELVFTIHTAGIISNPRAISITMSTSKIIKAFDVQVSLPVIGLDPNVDSIVVNELLEELPKGFTPKDEKDSEGDSLDREKPDKKGLLPIRVKVVRG